MYEYAKTLRAQEKCSWTWYLVPVAVVTVAMGGILLPRGPVDVDAFAVASASVEVMGAMPLTPSPQPGIGEPELRAEDLPQSY